MNWISDWALPKISGLFKRDVPENLWQPEREERDVRDRQCERAQRDRAQTTSRLRHDGARREGKRAGWPAPAV